MVSLMSKHRSFFETKLIIVTTLLVIVSADQRNDTICQTEDCKQTAKSIVTSIDKSVNPCDDFYKYSCGNFIKEHPATDKFNLLGESNIYNLSIHMIEDINNLLNHSSIEKDVKYAVPLINLYRGCINSTKRELNAKRDLNLIKDVLKRSGGFPLIDNNWNENDFNIENAIIESIKTTYTSSFLNIRVMKDITNNPNPIITMTDVSWPPNGALGIIATPFPIPFPKQNRGKGPKDNYYYKLTDNEKLALTEISEALNGSPIEPKLLENETIASKSVMISSLSSLQLLNADYLFTNYDKFKIPVKDLTAIKGLDFRRILEEVLKSENMTIGDNDIIFADKEYLKELANGLQKFSKRDIANKMALDLVMSLIKYSTIRLADMVAIYEGGAPVPLSQICVAYSMRYLPDLLGRYYYEKQFDKESIEDMKVFIASLKEAFNQILVENQWLDETTKKHAINKLNAISENIGFPESVFNLTELEEYYKPFVDFSENTFLPNMVKVLSHEKAMNFKLFKDENITKGHWEWPVNSVIVNAFYRPEMNGIYFPAGIAQYPFYQHTRPKSVNLGAIGMIISHELTHAFDNNGGRFDENGNLHNWFGKDSQDIFNNKSQCFVAQYQNVSYDFGNNTKHNINGLNTLGENIADNGGIRIAFRAMQLFKAKNGGQLPKLPGDLADYSDEQLFFSSFANLWCSNIALEALGVQLVLDSHSPEDSRVRESLSNFEEFAKAYNCPIGSRMNPKNKCVLWG